MKKFLVYIISLLFVNLIITSKLLAINIAVSIKPLHSLVSMVTDGILTPELIVKGNTSSHSIQLTAKNIKIINNSDLVFIASKNLEVPIYKALINKSNLYQMIDLKGLTILKFYQDNLIFKDSNNLIHNCDDIDYHIWLDPKNAITILFEITKILSNKDPNNADKYKTNALKFSKKIEELHLSLQDSFSQYKFSTYILYHNGFSYLENRYNLQNTGIIQDSCDVSCNILSNNLSNKKLLYLLNFIHQHEVKCVFIEPEFNNKVLINFLKKNNINYFTIDPIGTNIKPGKDLYFVLLINILNSFKRCLD